MPDQVTFSASLEDNVTPNLEKLEKQLQEMGKSPVEIKMIIDAVDDASPKIKAAQAQMERMPKAHKISLDFQGGIDKFKEEMSKAKSEVSKPITVPFQFLDQDGHKLGSAMSSLFNVRSKIALPLVGSLPGSNMLYGVGAGAGIAGAITGLSGLLQKSFQDNSELEQSHQTLAVALKDNAGATTELQKVIAAASKSPFSTQQTLQADIIGRSYQMPVWAGQNKQVPQGYLAISQNMAAAMHTSPDDSMQALAMARQGQYRRLLQYGVRMQASDFGSGGRFAGMSNDQALEMATKRFQGSMDAQLHTFQGMMSNIKDVFSEQIVRPIGQNVFQSVEGKTGGLEKALGSGDTQRKIGSAVEQFQHLTTTVINDLTKIKDYFNTHLKQPIEDVVSAIKTLGTSFGQAFGGTAVTVIKTFANALTSLAAPLNSIVHAVPFLGTMMGYMKALNMMGMGGMAKPLTTATNALNPMNPASPLGILKAPFQLPGMAIKWAGFAAVTDIINAHKAAADMNDQFKQTPQLLDDINAKVSELATGLGVSNTHFKNNVAAVAQMIPMGAMSASGRAQLAEETARAGFQISHITGVGASANQRAIVDQMKLSNDYSMDAMHRFGTELISLQEVAKELGVSWSDVTRIMSTFAAQAGPIGLGGLAGAPAITALATGFNRQPVTKNQLAAGFYTPDAVMSQLLTQYGSPDIPDLMKIPKGKLGKYWNFKNNPGATSRYGADEGTYEQQAQAALHAQQRSQAFIGRYAPTAVAPGQYQMVQPPVPWLTQHYGVDFGKFGPAVAGAPHGAGVTRSPGEGAQNVEEAWARTVKDFNAAQTAIANYQTKTQQTQNTLDQLNQAQASVNLQMQAFQQVITLQSRKVEDAQLALSEYTFQHLRPLEEELTRVQNAMDLVNHSMTDAQYNMTKFADGLLMGEQAALNQLHALTLYNQQLQFLQLQYTTIGGQLGTQVYERGYSARVKPLEGLSLQEQMQQLQRRQQLAQMHYDITYGEGHYKMQQAQRTQFQKKELPLDERLKGITENQGIIDKATVQAHNIGEVQFALQQKMFKVNQVIQTQTDHLTRLQLSLQGLEQSKKMRNFQDEQFHLGQKIGETNLKLNEQNIILGQYQNTIDDLNQRKQDLGSLFKAMIDFSHIGPGGLTAASKAIREGMATGFIPKAEGRNLLATVHDARGVLQHTQTTTQQWYHQKSSWITIIGQGIKGFFSGDDFRKLGDLAAKATGIGGLRLSGEVAGALMPIVTTVLGALMAGGAITWAFKRSLTHLLPASGLDAVGRHMGNVGERLGTVGEERGWKWATRTGGYFNDRSTPEGIRKALSGTLGEHLKEALSPILKPVEHFRENIFKGAFAMLGHLTGIPGAGVALGQVGKAIGKDATVREDVKAVETVVRDVGKSVGKVRAMADKVKITFKDIGKDDFFTKVPTWLKEARTQATIESVKTTFSSLQDSFKNILHMQPGTDTVKSATSDTARNLAKSNGHVASIRTNINEAVKGFTATHELTGKIATKAAQVAGHLGTALKIVGVLGTVVGTGMVGKDILGGHPGNAAKDFANFFTPLGIPSLLNLIPGVNIDIPGMSSPGLLHDNSLTTSQKQQLRALGISPKNIHPTRDTQGNAKQVLNAMLGHLVQMGEVVAPQGSPGGGIPLKSRLTAGGKAAQAAADEATSDIQMAASAKSLKSFGTYYKMAVAAEAKYHADILALKKKNVQSTQQLATDMTTQLLMEQTNFQNVSVGGAQGVKNYLTDISSLLSSNWQKRLKYITDSYTSEVQQHGAGYQAISSTTGSWLGAIDNQIKKWAKSWNLPIAEKGGGATGAISAAQGVLAGVAQVAQPGHLQPYEAGGLVKADQHKIGPGRVVRMVEEGHPEMVIPMAPHRRDRAKALLKQTRSMLGMATGGYVWPYSPGITSGRIDEGWDMAGSGSIAAIGDTGPLMQGQSGWPGTGQGFYYQLKNGIRAGQYVYVYENIIRKKALGKSAKAGEVIAQLLPAYPHLESGWSTSSGAPTSQGVYAEGVAEPAGYDFQKFLTGLTHGKLYGGGARGMGGGSNVPKIQLGNVPKALQGMGLIGAMQYRLLLDKQKQMGKHLNKARTKGGGGNLSGFTGGGSAQANEALGRKMMIAFGYSASQWPSLRDLWVGESGWSDTVMNNPSMGWLANGNASGIPQADGHGRVYKSGDAPAQIAWGLNYIKGTYGTPSNAYSQWLGRSPHWYAGGTPRVSEDELAVLHKDEMVISAAMANAARSQAKQGHASPSGYHDAQASNEWQKYLDIIMKQKSSIANIEYDIHKVRREIEAAKTKTEKKTDQEALDNLKKALLKHNASLEKATTAYTRAIGRDLTASGDKSAGENTLAGVSDQHARYKAVIKQTVTHAEKHSKAYKTATSKLKKDQHELTKLHGEKQTKAVRAKEKAVEKAIKLDETSIHKIVAGFKKEGSAKYAVSAAEKGISSGLMKAITGKSLNKTQDHAYNALEKAATNLAKGKAAHDSAKEIQKLQKQQQKDAQILTKAMEAHAKVSDKSRAALLKQAQQGTKDSGKSHDTTSKYQTNHQAHMKTTEKHQQVMENHQTMIEKKLDTLIKKDTSISITAVGATVTTKPPVRAKSK